MSNLAQINLNNLKYNAEKIKKTLKQGVKFCAVVKANAYGHGDVECANALYKIADCFAVALLEEGVRLRLSGIDKDILVLTPVDSEELSTAISYRLSLSVSSVLEVKRIAKESEKQGKVTKIHIAYNTGMNRLGVDGIEELKKTLKCIEQFSYVKLEGFYSHFANPENKKQLRCALNKFLLAKKLIKSYNKEVTCHISSSGGYLLGIQEDMVRIGILLYGYKPFASEIKLKPVMKVYSSVVKPRTLKIGESALYGYKPADKKTDIAIIRYGYADGLERREVEGQFNNRCMDLTAIKSSQKKGRVCILDNADTLAKKYHTISYEILCSVASRAQKKYIR